MVLLRTECIRASGRLARQNRVAVIAPIVIFFAVAFVLLFVLFLLWLLSKEDIGSYRAMRLFSVKVLWRCSAHGQSYASHLLRGPANAEWPGRQELFARGAQRRSLISDVSARRLRQAGRGGTAPHLGQNVARLNRFSFPFGSLNQDDFLLYAVQAVVSPLPRPAAR